ncbi:MAG: hypothetical protein V4717_03020 [Bacteroidota bacterium]
MKVTPTIYGDITESIFEQVAADFKADPSLLNYEREIVQDGRTTILSIEIDPGGGFEGGFELTTIVSKVRTKPICLFKIHHKGFLDEIGKLLGMQDVITGYAEFDEKVIVKTNDADRVKHLFEDSFVRNVFGSLANYTLGTTKQHLPNNPDSIALEFTIDSAIFNAEELRNIYTAFTMVLDNLEPGAEQ